MEASEKDVRQQAREKDVREDAPAPEKSTKGVSVSENTSWSLSTVLVAGIALRLLILTQLPRISLILDASVQCSTPVSSYKRLQEGVFQYRHGASPYAGGVCHQSPLLLALFSLLPAGSSGLFAANVLYSVVDGVTAASLAAVARSVGKKPIGKSPASYTPALVAVTYLFNPFTLLSTLAKSTAVFSNVAIATALHSAVTGRPGLSMSLLAVAATLSFYPAYIVPATILLIRQHRPVGTLVEQVARLAGVFVASTACLIGVSFVPTGSWDFVGATYSVMILFQELIPNIGLWWYFFTEMFDFFRPFFIGVFQIYIAGFTVPMTIRLRTQPLFVVATLLGIHAVFQPYPEAGHLGLYLAVLALCRPIVERESTNVFVLTSFRSSNTVLQYRLFIALVMLYSAVLAPTFYYLWIYLGSGNSNFFYAITLVHAVGITLLLADTVWAAVRIDYDGGANPKLVQI